jgi:hypothetical protein
MRIINSIAICYLLTLLISCSASKPTATPEPKMTRQSANFDYTPPKREPVGSAGVTIALVAPNYIGKGAEFSSSPFQEMATSMGNDFEELLTAKGFTIRGPFKSRDEMVFNDKRNSSFVLTVEIDFQFQMERKYKTVNTASWGKLLDPNAKFYSSNYMYSGAGNLGGNLIVTAFSPSFGEKLWKKNISMEPIPFSYEGSEQWTVPTATLGDEYAKDAKVYNALIKQLEKYYQSAFDLVARQIEVSEMKSVATEASKAEKKG